LFNSFGVGERGRGNFPGCNLGLFIFKPFRLAVEIIPTYQMYG
jgi:hypothetical protein